MNDRVLGGLAWVAFAHALILRANGMDRMIHSHPFAPCKMGRIHSDYLS